MTDKKLNIITKVWRGQKQIQSLMSLNSERPATLLSTLVLAEGRAIELLKISSKILCR